MKTTILAALATASAFTFMAFAPAHAWASSPTDLVCNIHDTAGNNLFYTFDGNTKNSDGTLGGTMVETGFEKNDVSTISEVGQRPVWIWSGNKVGGVTLWPQRNQSWLLGLDPWKIKERFYTATAHLFHNGHFIGEGACVRDVAAVNGDANDANHIGDQGI
jgi:hypothetical protein